MTAAPPPELDSTLPVDAAGETPWRRLSARMLLVHPIRELGQLLAPFLGLFILGRVRDDGLPPLVQAGFLVVPILLGLARWLTTTYRFTEHQLQLRSGLLKRSTLSAPLDRVRTVDVTSSPLHRILGLASVNVGTGADRAITLDGLPVAEARRLRIELHGRGAAGEGAAAGAAPESWATAGGDAGRAAGGLGAAGADAGTTDPPLSRAGSAEAGASHAAAPGREGADEIELARFDPRWLRFAPFTDAGLVTALAGLGFFGRYLGDLRARFASTAVGRSLGEHWANAGFVVLVVEVTLGVIVVLVVISLVVYVLTYWGYRLSRHDRGTLQVRRGLLTARATSLDETRVRGVRLSEPLLLRLVSGASLNALTTRLHGREGATSDLLTPPAPRGLAIRVGTDVIAALSGRGVRGRSPAAGPLPAADPEGLWGAEAALTGPLTAHGPAAVRRRYTRALLAALVTVGVLAVLTWHFGWAWLLPAVVAAFLLPVSAALGWDRSRSLGHRLTGGLLVARSGSLPRRRTVATVDGIIGWTVRSTYFQRRAGLVTLSAMTATGMGTIDIIDVPLEAAWQVMRAGSGDWLEEVRGPALERV